MSLKDSQTKSDELNRKTIVFSEKSAISQIENVRELFDKAVEEDCDKITIDLEKLEYLCSTSLAVLVRMKKITVEKTIEFELANPSSYILEIFRTTRLLEFFKN